ncbi:hypothetical protein Tco_1263932 [Tanacetum coccineum]
MEYNQSSDQSSVSFDVVDVSSGPSDNVLTSFTEEIVAYEQDSDQTQAINKTDKKKKKNKSQSADEVADKEKEDEKVDLFYKEDGLYKGGLKVMEKETWFKNQLMLRKEECWLKNQLMFRKKESLVKNLLMFRKKEAWLQTVDVTFDVQEEGVVAQESVEVQEEEESSSEDDEELV